MGDFQAIGLLGLGVAACFLLDWAAIAMDWKLIKPFTKPLAMVMVILWTAFSLGEGISLLVGLLLAAQIFGLLGDILLLFPDRAFSASLSAFLMGHLFYLGLLINRIIAPLFSGGASFIDQLRWLFLGFVLWIGILLFFYRLFRCLPDQEGVPGLLWTGIQAYTWVLGGMMVLALITAILSDGAIVDRIILPVGALLFLISDFMLTYNRFIKSFDRAQLWVRITYHLAQCGLAWGFLSLIG